MAPHSQPQLARPQLARSGPLAAPQDARPHDARTQSMSPVRGSMRSLGTRPWLATATLSGEVAARSAATSHAPSAVRRALLVPARPLRYVIAPFTWFGVQAGCTAMPSAAMQATIGAAIEVPHTRK